MRAERDPGLLSDAGVGASPADSPRRCGRCASRARPPSVMVTVEVRESSKPATCGLPESSDCCAASSVLLGIAERRKIASATAPLMLAATMPDPASAVSNVIGIVSPAFGESRSGDDEQRLGAALPRRHRLVAQVGVARQDALRLRDRRPRGSSAARGRPCPSRRASRSCRSRSSGCRARRCRSRRRRPAPLTSPLSEKESAWTSVRCVEGRRLPDALSRCHAIGEPPSRVPAVNSKGRRIVVLAGQRPRADALQLRDEVVARRAVRRSTPRAVLRARSDASAADVRARPQSVGAPAAVLQGARQQR